MPTVPLLSLWQCLFVQTFFLRYAGDGDKFRCKYVGSCDVTVATRTHCKCCRYEKCLRVGMRRRGKHSCTVFIAVMISLFTFAW